MNPNKDKIGWCDWTVNPIWGCKHACEYCYARKFAERRGMNFGEPRFYPERLDQFGQAKPGDRVFVGSMGDSLGAWVPREWIKAVIDECRKHPEIVFQFLTKNPKRYAEFEWPANCWLGTTVTNQRDWDTRAPTMFVNGKNITYISMEPLLEEIKFIDEIGLDHIYWLIIGGQTGPGAPETPDSWIANLIDEARNASIEIYIKDTHYDKFPIREFPVQLKAEPGLSVEGDAGAVNGTLF